jgi:hypothetical protein
MIAEYDKYHALSLKSDLLRRWYLSIGVGRKLMLSMSLLSTSSVLALPYYY